MSPISATTQPHVHSFNQFICEHISKGVSSAPPYGCVIEGPRQEKNQVSFQTTSITIGEPVVLDDLHETTNLTPRECRERRKTYSAPMNVSFACRVNDGDAEILTRSIGEMPIMVLSNRCHLLGLKEAGLISTREVCRVEIML
jgi:DNA-directed RNA polymerase I subunit RPA2